jgi:hypothetical protein
MALTDAQKAELNRMCPAAKDAALGTAIGALEAGIVAAELDGTTLEVGGSPSKVRLKDGGVSSAKLASALQALVLGAASGYKLARGQADVTGTADVTTGLTTVVAAVAALDDDISLAAMWVSAQLSATAGHIDLNVFKPTAVDDCTPIAGTAAAKVNWLAIGT